MEKKIYFTIAGLPFILLIAMIGSLGLGGGHGGIGALYLYLDIFSFILVVWGVRLMTKASKKGKRIFYLGLATLIASSVFIFQFLVLILSRIA